MSENSFMNRDVLKNRLRTLLDLKGWTEEVLEEKSGASQSTINRILNCTIESPRVSTLDKIAKALDVPLHILTSDDISTPENKINEPQAIYGPALTAINSIEQGYKDRSLSNEDLLIINALIKHLASNTQ